MIRAFAVLFTRLTPLFNQAEDGRRFLCGDCGGACRGRWGGSCAGPDAAAMGKTPSGGPTTNTSSASAPASEAATANDNLVTGAQVVPEEEGWSDVGPNEEAKGERKTAKVRKFRYEIGFFGGYRWLHEDNVLGPFIEDASTRAAKFSFFGARLTLNFNTWLAFEVEFDGAATKTRNAQRPLGSMATAAVFARPWCRRGQSAHSCFWAMAASRPYPEIPRWLTTTPMRLFTAVWECSFM